MEETLEIDFALLADAADASVAGKLFIMGGGISEIAATNFPATHPTMVLVLKLKLHPSECDRPHTLEIKFWDADGKRLQPEISGQFAAQRDSEQPARPVFVQLLFNILGLQLPAPGDYEFHIVVDGHYLRSLPLHVKKVDAPGQVPGQ
jgi:hypothetical protein